MTRPSESALLLRRMRDAPRHVLAVLHPVDGHVGVDGVAVPVRSVGTDQVQVVALFTMRLPIWLRLTVG